MSTAPTAQDRVLSTLNRDGTRRWLYPKLSEGRFLRWRRIAAYGLILLFTALPWISINGKQSILIDLPARRFTFFGTTFLPTDTLLLMLFVAAVFVTVFLITALFGRLWCGWACPQTVYMEFVYRPIERLFDGNPDTRRRGGGGARGVRRIAKYGVYLLISLFLAHTFLAYFVGVDRLFLWMRQSPFEHPTAFLVVAATTGLMMFDFCFFREQTCIVACPYGRFQSVMLDRNSMIISYDEQRGEPRGRLRRQKGADDAAQVKPGDCIDCQLCVITCPTGIDIREGLQMECIGCAQCIDACDAVMEKINRPRGLIRYTSQAALAAQGRRILRPRVIIYPLLLIVIVSAFLTVLLTRQSADVTVLRAGGRPYVTLSTGEIQNDVRIKVVNRTEAPRDYDFEVEGLPGVRLLVHDAPVTVDGGETVTVGVSLIAPAGSFERGQAKVTLRISDDAGFSRQKPYRLQGPWGSNSRRGEPGGGET